MRYLLILLTLLTLPLNVQELSRYVAVKVHKAFQARQDNRLSEAIAVLKQIEPKKEYDNAYVQRLLGVFYWQSGQLTKAEQALAVSVSLNVLEKTQQRDTRRMLADIQFYQQRFTPAITNYLAVIEQTQNREALAGYWLRVVQAYYALENWNKVLDAVAGYKAYVVKPEISALTMQFGAELSLELWSRAIKTVTQLRDLEPEKLVWWQHLYGLFLRTDQNREALAVLQQMERAGFALSRAEIRTLAQLYANQGIPVQAAEHYGLLAGEISDAKLLATQAKYWQQAREWHKALLSWEKAARLDSDYRWPYAQLLLRQREYSQALKQLDGIENPSEQMLLAKVNAYYRLNLIEEARKAASRAYRVSQNKSARQWLDYLAKLE